MSTWRQGLGYLLALSLLLVSLIGLTACRSTGTYSATFLDSFDTVLTVTVGASDHIAADKIISDVHTIVTDSLIPQKIKIGAPSSRSMHLCMTG